MVRCSDGSLYTGCTNDVLKRIEKHNSGQGAKYTRGRGPVVLVWMSPARSKSEALRSEFQVKNFSKHKKEHLAQFNSQGAMFDRYVACWRFSTALPSRYVSEREDIVRTFSWAVPNEEALRTICTFGPIVEMGAGTGYWAWLLRGYGCDIIAYDKSPPGQVSGRLVNIWHPGGLVFTKMLLGGPDNLQQHSDRSLFLCWPPREDPMARQCLDNWKGKYMIFVGDSEITADGDFYEKLHGGFTLIRTVNIPTFFSMNDTLTVWQRK